MRDKKNHIPNPANRESVNRLLNRVKILVRAMKENQNPKDALE